MDELKDEARVRREGEARRRAEPQHQRVGRRQKRSRHEEGGERKGSCRARPTRKTGLERRACAQRPGQRVLGVLLAGLARSGASAKNQRGGAPARCPSASTRPRSPRARSAARERADEAQVEVAVTGLLERWWRRSGSGSAIRYASAGAAILLRGERERTARHGRRPAEVRCSRSRSAAARRARRGSAATSDAP